MIKNQISVFVRLSASAMLRFPNCVITPEDFEQIDAFDDQRRSKFRRIDVVGDRHWIGCRHTAYSFVENPHVGPRRRLKQPWWRAQSWRLRVNRLCLQWIFKISFMI